MKSPPPMHDINSFFHIPKFNRGINCLGVVDDVGFRFNVWFWGCLCYGTLSAQSHHPYMRPSPNGSFSTNT